MNILLTGGSGFIGGYIVQECLRRKLGVVTILDMKEPGYYRNENALWTRGSVLSPDEVLGEKEFDLVIHAAAILGSHTTFGHIPETYDVNVMGTVRMLELISKWHTKPNFVHLSLIRNWSNAYMETKHAADKAGLIYANYREARILNLGMTVVYGPRQGWETEKAVPTFFLHALQNEPLEIYGDGLSTVNMMFVRDVAALIVDLAVNDLIFNNAVRQMQLAYPHGDVSVIELADTINTLTASNAGCVNIDMREGQPEAADPAKYDLGAVKRYVSDYDDRFAPLDEGLLKTMHYYEGVL